MIIWYSATAQYFYFWLESQNVEMFALYLVNCYSACKIFMGVDSSGQWSQDTPSQNGEMTLTSMFTKNFCLLCVLFVRIILWSKAIVVLPNAAMSEVFDTRRYLSSEPRILSEAKCRRYWKYRLSSGPPYVRTVFRLRLRPNWTTIWIGQQCPVSGSVMLLRQ